MQTESVSKIKRLDQSGYPLLVARLLLGVVFLLMGWNKVSDPIAFLKLLREYEMFPSSAYVLENAIALTLPWIEVICGLALIAGVFVRGAAFALLVMLTGFTIVIAIRAIGMYNTGEFKSFCDVKFDCGCGGGLIGMCRKLPENFGLWLACWIPFLSTSRRFCLASLLGNTPSTDSEAAANPTKITTESATS
ncbi:MAG TPA: DoxX family protein [Phycisphaerae bacterium]|nr:DoxX family protein [Phycisphaerae bacterium]